MAKETYYFSHDSNALTDTKILNMRADYGLEGYGLYWVIIEMMRNEDDYKLELNKNTYRAIKTLTNTNIDIEKFIKDCLEDYQLFRQDEEKFYSNSLLRRMQEKDKKSAIAREKAEKRWNGNTKDMQEQCSSNANKVNKSKVNKSKVNKNKENELEKNNYGEFQNVFFTEEQYKKLQILFPKDYQERIQKLDDYIQSTGKKYKDCLATLRNWARKDGYVFPSEEKSYKENQMTEEEYFKNGGGKKYV